MMIDWSLTVAFIKDIATALAAAVGIYVALDGLSTWKKQLKGKTEYELARRLLKSVYKLRDAIDIVRNPLQTAGETYLALDESATDIKQADPNWNLVANSAVFKKRWAKIVDAFLDIEVEQLEAEVLFGDEIQSYISNLKRKVLQLNSNIDIYLQSLSDIHRRSLTNDVIQAATQIIWGQLSDNSNQFSREVNEIIEKIENAIKPYLTLS
jgi:hypothetical protein